MRRLRNLAANLAVFGGACAVALVFGEGGLRLLGRPTAEDGWRSVPPLEQRVATIPPKASGRLRMLALGDSFTEYRDGTGENWARLLATEARHDGVDIELWNLGQAGTSVPHYLKNLRSYGRALSPDIVAVGLYLGNDPFEYELEREKKHRGLPPDPVQTIGRRPAGLLTSLRSRSRLVAALNALQKQLAARAGSRNTTFDANLRHAAEIYGLGPHVVDERVAAGNAEMLRLARADAINGWDLAFGLLRPGRYVEQILLPEGSPTLQAFEDMEQDLDALDAECRAVARHCLYVVIPCSLQVHPRYFAYYESLGFQTDARTVGESPLLRRTREYFETRGRLAVDPLPELRAAATEPYLPMDTHLSVDGQQIVGRAAWERLRSVLKPAAASYRQSWE